MMRSRLHLSVLVFFAFSCLCPTATSNGTASQKSRNMDTDNHLDIIKELLDTFDVVQLPKLYEAEDKYDKSVSGSLKTPPQAKYENTKWISEPYNRPRPPVQVPTKLVATWSRSQHLLRLTATIPPANSELTLYYLEHKSHVYWVSQRQPLQLNKIDDTLSVVRVRMNRRPKAVRVRVEFGGTVLRSGEQTVGGSLGRVHALISGYHRQYTNDDTDLSDELRDIVAKFSVQVPTKLFATWSRNQLRLTAIIPPTNSELTLYYLEYKRPKMKNKRHLYWFSQRQPLQLNKIDDTLSGARIRMYQRPKEVRVRVEFGGTVLRSGEQTVGDSLGREHALVSGYHRQYTNDDTDLPDELRDIVAKFTDNISSTNNGETEEIKREENADSDYFVGGHWRSVHRQEDSPTTVSLYIGSPMPYSANSKKEFTIDHRNKLDEVQERHIVPANEMGDVYDTFEVGPDKDAYFWIEEYEQNNPISKGFSYVGGVSKTVESK
eukprot:18993_1